MVIPPGRREVNGRRFFVPAQRVAIFDDFALLGLAMMAVFLNNQPVNVAGFLQQTRDFLCRLGVLGVVVGKRRAGLPNDQRVQADS